MASASDVANLEAHYFDQVGRRNSDGRDCRLQGAWQLSQDIEIGRPGFEVAVDVYLKNGLITKRYAYDDVVVAPPA